MSQDEWIKAVPDNAEALPEWLAAGMRLWDDMEAMGRALNDACGEACHTDLPRAERFGRGLIMLGERLEEEKEIALGEMAVGDALRLQMRYHEGCALLDQAAARFLDIGDEVGWARTRIGWLGTVHHLSNPPAPKPIVERAATIFRQHKEWAWLSTLCHNYAYHCAVVGELSEWLDWCLEARQAAEQIEEKRFVPLIASVNMLISVYDDLGQYETAQQTVEEALQLFKGHEQIVHRYVDFLIRAGSFYLNTGRYTQTLFYFYEARRRATSLWGQYFADIMIGTAYLRLNRLDESESQFRSVLEQISGKPDLIPLENTTRVRLAEVYSQQRDWQEALWILEPAIKLMEGQQKNTRLWLSKAYQLKALLRYHLGQQAQVKELVHEAIGLAEDAGEPLTVIEAYMVAAEVAESNEEAKEWLTHARDRTSEIPWLRWRVHQLSAQRTNDPVQRRESLILAANDLDQVQSSLAASFHANYLTDAQALYDDLIALHIEQKDVGLAWQTLERAKSRALINTMMYQQEATTPADSPIVAELKRLQLRHYTLVKGQIDRRSARTAEMREVESQIARLQEAIEVEQLGRREPLTVPPLYVPKAGPNSDLVGFYLVREEVHGFVHNGQNYHHVRLPTSGSKLNELIRVLYQNMRTTPAAPASWINPLTTQLHKILEQFDRYLLAPLRPFLRHEKLVIVPHGLLHQLPFHLLRHEGCYLLQKREIRVIPTARSPLRSPLDRSPKSAPSHVVVSHSWEGGLPHTKAEGEMVATTLGDTLHLDGVKATKEALLKMMGTRGVLHIAAHGEHRPDRPELSHIQLEDGQLSMVDLFQQSLQNSLVTLSACDTGQAVVRAGDDPVGLWRGFLAAGARSLLVSLWQLEDQSALRLMRNFYQKLAAGTPKVAALRSVQREWLTHAKGRLRHPFYWGALQLIGDDGPLAGDRD
ncbi:MAG: CHAT domain-containing protein [Ardenticatenaceae bacterium]